MMNRIIVFLLVIGIISSAQSQVSFQKLYEGGFGDILPLPDSGFIFSGSILMAGGGNSMGYIFRTNQHGDTVWTRTLDTFESFHIGTVRPVTGGGFILSGNYGGSSYDLFMIKTDSTGIPIWSRTYGTGSDEISAGAIPAIDNGYLLTGSSSIGFGTLYLVRTDENGNEVCHKHYGAGGSFYPSAIHQLADSSILIAGYTDMSVNVDPFLMKTDTAGNLIWAKRYNGGSYEDVTYGQPTSDGGYIMAGEICAAYCDVYLLKTDANGDVEWSKKYGGTLDDWAWSVCQAADDGYAMAGGTENFGAQGPDFYMVKTDSFGNEEWSDRSGGANNDNGYIIKKTNDHGFITMGLSQSFGSTSGMYVVKTDSSGFSGCNSTVPATITTTVNTSAFNLGFTITSYSVVDTFSCVTGSAGTDSLLCLFFTGVSIPEDEKSLLIYPNPASSILNIQFQSLQKVAVEIINSIGQIVFIGKTDDEQMIVDVNAFEPGIYFIRINTGKEIRTAIFSVIK